MRFVLFLTVMFAVGAAWAISDDANPWLAIESATCAAHRGTDYAAQLDMDVAIEVAEWRGATLTHDMHCFIGGTLEGTAFEIGLLTEHPGTAYATACADSHLRLIRVLTPSGQAPDCRPW